MADKKTDIPGFYKSSDGALINKDNEALAAYKKRKQKDKEVDEMREDITSLKSDMEEIKKLLQKALK